MTRTKRHLLIDMVAIALCAAICGAEECADVERFGKNEEGMVCPVSRASQRHPLARCVREGASMFLRRCERRKSGKRHTYWALVESYRTAQGSRQRVV